MPIPKMARTLLRYIMKDGGGWIWIRKAKGLEVGPKVLVAASEAKNIINLRDPGVFHRTREANVFQHRLELSRDSSLTGL